MQAFVVSLGIGLLLMATMVVVALASGMTEVDAITLSTLRPFNQATLTTAPAVIGGGVLPRRVLPGMAVIGLGFIVGIALLAWVRSSPPLRMGQKGSASWKHTASAPPLSPACS
ncbi:MAG: hypothetical protein Q7U32_09425, partial [Rhodocyclaceae bacterium]|nr:hypothetical protein [Rhodocyclaceae bacterium]